MILKGVLRKLVKLKLVDGLLTCYFKLKGRTSYTNHQTFGSSFSPRGFKFDFHQ